jgi:multiple sugar transport system substrate-binding protein
VLLTGVLLPSAAAQTPLSVGGAVTVGSNNSDATPKAGFAALMSYCAQATGVTPVITTIDHAQFQNTITSYLKGAPDDLFTWFGGHRMRFLAAQGLTTDISDVWQQVGGHYSAALKAASTGFDGKQYFVPLSQYPWVVIYRKSLFQEKGYQVPTTLDEFVGLARRMQADGLVPLAFGNRDGWPAMGTFDILDMRMNGYAFHMGLMSGREKWTDPRVKAVFQKWAGLLPYYQANADTRSWQDAARSLINREAGMYFLGTFAIDEATDPTVRDDLAIFPFPLFGNRFDGERAVDAPIDGLMLSTTPANAEGARALLGCAASGAAQLTFLQTNKGLVAAARDVDTSGYTPLQKQMAEVVNASVAVAQFLDRDTRPDFVAPGGLPAFLAAFLGNPSQDLDAYLRRIQSFWNSLTPQIRPTIAVRPSKPAGTIPRATTVTFTATVRPLAAAPATVRFAAYRRISGVSRLVAARDVVADRSGRATFRYTFSTAGSWYVRARVQPNNTFFVSSWTSPIRYVVR